MLDYRLACAKEEEKIGILLVLLVTKIWWHLKVGMETPQNDFQIHRPLNDHCRALFSFRGNIAEIISKNRFRAITFDWSVL